MLRENEMIGIKNEPGSLLENWKFSPFGAELIILSHFFVFFRFVINN